MAASSPEGKYIELGETDEADSKDSKRTAPSSSSAGKGIPFDMKESKGIYVAESKQVFGDQTEPSTSAIDQPKDAKETIGGSNTNVLSSSSITSSPSNSTASASQSVNIGGGGNIGGGMKVDNYYSESDSEEEEEIRDEQGRILHGYLSKEELAAMQEALADESTPKLDTQQILDLKEAFDIFDKDGSGSIDYHELEHLMRIFRKNITSDEIKKMIDSTGQSDSGEISFEEFVPLMAPVFKLNDRDGAIADAFNVFDLDQNGFLSAKELHQIMMGLGDADITLADIDDMISLVDKDGDGQISFDEFKHHILLDPNAVMSDMFEIKKKKNIVSSTGDALYRRGSVLLGSAFTHKS